ncbi:MAG TPA: hypothetical protein VNE62_00845 [Actinomycetota bacterium]|nr:hypothetical protein [Actinomycetota bacterium]
MTGRTDPRVEEALREAERTVAGGRGLGGTGFWRAVGLLRRDPVLAEAYAARVAEIDRRAFENGVRLRLPASAGVAGLAVLTGGGAAAVALSGKLDDLSQTLVFLGGFGSLLVGSHSLTHWLVGRAAGMRFTHVFLGGPPPPRPGLKVDYATYLTKSPRTRAVMHASGAVVTKVVPFALMPAASGLQARRWLVPGLAVVGVVQILTDLLFSTKTSDWKKVRRELRAGRSIRGG